jgi:hypothetical protein
MGVEDNGRRRTAERFIALAFVVIGAGCGRVGYGIAGRADAFDATGDTPIGDGAPIDAACDGCVPCVGSPSCVCATYAGHAYQLCSAAEMRVDAANACAGAGMRLVRIDDDLENLWLRATCDSLGIAEVWIGAEDPSATSEWQWPDAVVFWSGAAGGAPVGGLYSRWYPGRPMGSAQRLCAGLWNIGSGGTWDDRSCTSVLPYVCELY